MGRRGRVQRKATGTGLAEVAIACVILVSMALFAIDIGTAMVLYNYNDRACRDAAREAANGQDTIEALRLANLTLQNWAQDPRKCLIRMNPIVKEIRYNDFNGNPPDGQSPFVSVTVRTEVRSIAPFRLAGVQVIRDNFTVQKTYTFPIVKMKVRQTTSQT